MALGALPGHLCLPDIGRTPSAVSPYTLSASGDKVAALIQVPKTGNIDRIQFRTNAVTSAQTLRVSLQTVDGSGDPTGTLYGGSAAGTKASPAATTLYELTLGTPAAATAGDVIAVVIEFDGTVGNLQIAFSTTSAALFPYVDRQSSSIWTKTSQMPVVALRYDDGSYPDLGCVIAQTIATLDHTVSTTPDEYALAYSLPWGARCVGFWSMCIMATAGNYEVNLYSGTTALKTLTMDGDVRGGAGGGTVSRWLFASPQTLTASALYRIGIRPTTAAANQRQYYFDLGSANAAWMISWPLGTAAYLSSRVDQGAWTDVLYQRPFCGPIIDAIDTGGGSRGLRTGGVL